MSDNVIYTSLSRLCLKEWGSQCFKWGLCYWQSAFLWIFCSAYEELNISGAELTQAYDPYSSKSFSKRILEAHYTLKEPSLSEVTSSPLVPGPGHFFYYSIRVKARDICFYKPISMLKESQLFCTLMYSWNYQVLSLTLPIFTYPINSYNKQFFLHLASFNIQYVIVPIHVIGLQYV